jgi:hypothetical protein
MCPQQYTDDDLEKEVQAKKLTAPRVNRDLIDGKIVEAHYYRFPNTTLTVCALEMENGFLAVGHSAAASPENFDAEVGRKLAYEHAYSTLWALEGYLLREKILNGVDKL